MSVVSIRAGRVIHDGGDGWKFRKGDYVFLSHVDKVERNLMQVQGYDAFMQVVVVFVRDKGRKRVPWDVWSERSLVSAAKYGFYTREM